MHGHKLNILSFQGEKGAKLKQLGLIPIIGVNTVYIVGEIEVDKLAKALKVKSSELTLISDEEFKKLGKLKPELFSHKKVAKDDQTEKSELGQTFSVHNTTLYPELGSGLDDTKVEPTEPDSVSEVEPPAYPGSVKNLADMSESKPIDLYKVNFVAPGLRLGDANQTESTITALRLADSLKAVTQPQLIYLTVTTAKRDDLFEVMSNEERASLDEFIKFLRRNFGTYESALSATVLFDEAKQNESESDHTYLARLTNLYYRVKGQSKPKIIPDNEKNAIRNKFIKSLNRVEVQKHILNNLNRIPFEQLATEAQYSREALKVVGDNLSKPLSVMAIGEAKNRFRDRSNSRGRYSGHDYNRDHKRFDRSNSRGRDSRRSFYDRSKRSSSSSSEDS